MLYCPPDYLTNMKNNKYTKKQIEAMENLVYDLDGLDNKPRRLFHSLVNFATEMIDEEDKLCEVVDCIDQFENHYYTIKKMPEIAEDILRIKFDIERELLSCKKAKEMNDEEKWGVYKNAVEKALKEYTKKILTNLVDIDL